MYASISIHIHPYIACMYFNSFVIATTSYSKLCMIALSNNLQYLYVVVINAAAAVVDGDDDDVVVDGDDLFLVLTGLFALLLSNHLHDA